MSARSRPGFPRSSFPHSGSIGPVRCGHPWRWPAWACWKPYRLPRPIAQRTRQPLDYNRQCLAEGLANLCGGFFQCLPGSGSLTRSAINHQAGAVTRWSGVFAAAAVAMVVLLFGPWARFIPKSGPGRHPHGDRGGTGRSLADPRAVRASRFDALLVLATALSAVLIGVEFSILIGVGLSILMFVPRAARLKASELAISSDRVIRDRQPTDACCTRMVLLDLEGEFFFGAAPELDRHFDGLRKRVGVRVIVLRVKRTCNPDIVCMERSAAFHCRDAGQRGNGAAVRRAARLRPGHAESAFSEFPLGRARFP